MKKRTRTEGVWANASPHERERLRLIELRMGGDISKADYDRDMRAIDEAERKAAVR